VSPAPVATEAIATATRRQPIRAVTAGSTATASAASGATRVAARAGSTDAATVTSRPVASAIVTDDGLITSGGWVLTTCSSPQLTAIPVSTPATDAVRPVRTDSASMLPNTCPRLAPTQRCSASSRDRCAIKILKVL